MISSIVLVKNEEKNIVNVVKKLSWTDEQIVVDNGSVDNTFKEAEKTGAIVVIIREMDFSLMRNAAAAKAKSDWLLYVDTDEEISPDLKKEILEIVKSKPSLTDPRAFYIKRKNYFMHNLWPFDDGMIRLIYKPSLKGWSGRVHESADIQGEIAVLNNFLIHNTHNTLEDMLIQTNDWSEIESELRIKSHHPEIVSWRLFRVLVTGFFNSYFKQGGWKVGTIGIIESMYQGFSLFITYSKLWEKQQKGI